MAMLNKIEEQSGLVVDDAYCVIEAIQLSKFCDPIAIVRFYASEKDYLNKKPAFSEMQFSFVYDNSSNPYEIAYSHLKTLESFANAIDV